MTTTSSTTSSNQSAVAAAGSSILTSLGAGSGIDTASLVSNLVTASFANKEKTLTATQSLNTAQVSALGSLTSGLDSFSKALQTLVSGGTLRSQPSSSNSAIVTATASSGANISNLSANIEIRQLAQAQSLVSVPLTGSAPTVGQGSLTLTTPAGNFTITITPANDSLDGLAKAINDANSGATPSGVTASVVSDSSGKRLVLKGASGGTNGFSLAANSGASADLTRFTFDPGNVPGSPMTRAQQAQDAIIRMDGVDSTYSTNTVTSLIDGVTLRLVTAQPGTTVTLGVTRPSAAITQAVSDYVDAYNELATQIATATAAATDSSDAGPLYGAPGVKEMLRQLRKITSTTLTTLPNGPQTLAEIGVSTGHDGKLSVDTTKLSAAVAAYPDSVEAMFNPGQRSSDPLLQITSSLGATKPGVYTVHDILSGPPVTGKLGVGSDESSFLPHPTDPSGLTSSISSIVPGLSIHVLGNVTTATISIDAGIVGVLQGIRDDLLKNTVTAKGALTAAGDTLSTKSKSLTAARDKLTAQEAAYSAQLTKQFTAMQNAVSSYKSIQSYMTQQIAQWSKSS